MTKCIPPVIVAATAFILSIPLLGQNITPEFRMETFAPLDTSVSFRGIYSRTENDVWVTGSKGAVYHSSNRGGSFVKVSVTNSADSDFRDVQALGDSTILIMSVGPGGNSKILKSTENGRSWKVVFTNPHEEGFLNSVAFWDAAHGIAVGDPVKGHLYVLLTSDAGDTWTETASDHIPAARPNEHSFAASGTCVTVRGRDHVWVATGGAAARVLSTNDRGKSWHVFDTPILHGDNSTGIFSVFFRDSENGIVVGGDYTKETAATKTVALTTDGGKSWNLQPDDTLPFQSSAAEIVVAGESYWVTTGPAGVYFSMNGQEWEKVSDLGYHCLSVPSEGGIVYLAGSAGRVAALHVDE